MANRFLGAPQAFFFFLLWRRVAFALNIFPKYYTTILDVFLAHLNIAMPAKTNVIAMLKVANLV